VIPILRDQMPRELSDEIISVLSLGIDTTEHELIEESLKAFRTHESVSDSQKIERFLNEYRGDDLAVAGVADTLAALSNGQVEEMLIAAKPSSLQYDQAEVEKVLQVYGADEDLLTTVSPRTLADELIRRANQLSSARVTFIEDSTRLDKVGGVGAILRYRISDNSAAPYEQSGVVSRSEAMVET